MLSRRSFLKLSTVSSLIAVAPGLSVASAPGDNRFVFVILRGGMDGLDIVQPYGDPAYAGFRPTFARTPRTGLIDLDGFFGLNQGLSGLAGLWDSKELAFVHSASSPYRARSHFEAQDTLENGTQSNVGARDGWLNRFLSLMPPGDPDFAADVTPGGSLVLEGSRPVDRWTPNAELTLSAGTEAFLRALYKDHPDFTNALDRAIAAEADDLDGADRRGATKAGSFAKLAAKMLSDRARVAALSINGWDSHQNQEAALKAPMRQLADVMITLKKELGSLWQQTTVAAVSEFGRTVRENGTKGTDHGTGGLMIIAGGNVRGGRIIARWPGLSEEDLLDGRDLAPTDDVRRHLGWLLTGLFGADKGAIARVVFPGMELGPDPSLL